MLMDEIQRKGGAAVQELTVMTFNVKRDLWHFGRHTWQRRNQLVAGMINQLQPHILGTQELTQSTLEDLGRLLPQYSYVGVGRGGSNRGEYTAIFYRKELFHLLSYETFWLSPTPRRPSRDHTALFARTCTWCELVHRDSPDRPLRVYNTHLDHLSYFARVRGLGLIAGEILQRYHTAPGPVVLMGDFNAGPQSHTLRRWAQMALGEDGTQTLFSAYSLLGSAAGRPAPGRSYHGFRGKVTGTPIDHIFTTKDVQLREVAILSSRVGEDYPSDHYPVVAKIQY